MSSRKESVNIWNYDWKPSWYSRTPNPTVSHQSKSKWLGLSLGISAKSPSEFPSLTISFVNLYCFMNSSASFRVRNVLKHAWGNLLTSSSAPDLEWLVREASVSLGGLQTGKIKIRRFACHVLLHNKPVRLFLEGLHQRWSWKGICRY